MICEASVDKASEDELFQFRKREDSDETLVTFGLIMPDEETLDPLGLLWDDDISPCTVGFRMFTKNRTLRLMSHVCRTWRARLTHSKSLWGDIAFDATEPKSVRLAGDFLDMTRDSTVSLRIYAGFGGSFDPEVSTLLQDLRTYIDRWQVFEYEGQLKEYQQYLDLGAQRLVRFSDHHDFSSVLLPPQDIFAGQTPSLRSLSTSQIWNWPAGALSNLTELNVVYSQQPQPFSLKSLFNVLHATPNLEVLRLASPTPPVLDCAASEVANLPQLETLRLYNPNIYFLVPHLQLPSLRGVMFSSSYDRWSHPHSHPVSRAHDLFSPFPPIDLLEQKFSLVEVQIGFLPNGVLRFGAHLYSDDEYFFGVHLNLFGEGWCRWKGFFKRSITKLAERIQLDPMACLQFTSDLPLDCDSFLGFNTIRVLTFGGRGRDIMQTLICVSHETPPAMPFPHLEELTLLDEGMSIYDIPLIIVCLQSREDLTIVMRDTHGPFLRVSNSLDVVEGECPPQTFYPTNFDPFLQLILPVSCVFASETDESRVEVVGAGSYSLGGIRRSALPLIQVNAISGPGSCKYYERRTSVAHDPVINSPVFRQLKRGSIRQRCIVVVRFSIRAEKKFNRWSLRDNRKRLQ